MNQSQSAGSAFRWFHHETDASTDAFRTRPFSLDNFLFFLPFVEQRSRTLSGMLFLYTHVRAQARRPARDYYEQKGGETERFSRWPSIGPRSFSFFPQAGARLPKLQASRLRVPSPFSLQCLLSLLLVSSPCFLSLFLLPYRRSPYAPSRDI